MKNKFTPKDEDLEDGPVFEDLAEELAELESGDSFPPSPRLGAAAPATVQVGMLEARGPGVAEGSTGDEGGVVIGGVALRPNSRSPRSPRALSLMESCVLRSASVHLPGFCSPGLGRKGRIARQF